MSYYQGDYYQGDIWGKIGKGLRKLGKNVGRVVKQVAPYAGLLLPAVGTATLVGRGIAAAGKIKKAGRTARSLVSTMTVQPTPYQTPQAMMSQMLGQTVGMPAPGTWTQTGNTKVTPHDGTLYETVDNTGARFWARPGEDPELQYRALLRGSRPKPRPRRRATRRRRTTRARARRAYTTRRRRTRRRSTR